MNFVVCFLGAVRASIFCTHQKNRKELNELMILDYCSNPCIMKWDTIKSSFYLVIKVKCAYWFWLIVFDSTLTHLLNVKCIIKFQYSKIANILLQKFVIKFLSHIPIFTHIPYSRLRKIASYFNFTITVRSGCFL